MPKIENGVNEQLLDALNSAKTTAHARNAAAYEAAVLAIRGAYTESEIATFDQQREEVSSVDCPMLTAIAQERGMGVDELKQRVLGKITAYSKKMGAAIGRHRRITQDIEAGETVDAVLAITADYSDII